MSVDRASSRRLVLSRFTPVLALPLMGCVAVNIVVSDDGGETTTTVGAYVTVGVTVGSGGSGTGSGGAGGSAPEETCPGLEVPVALGATVSLSGDTSAAADDWKTFCADSDASTSAKDLVYHLRLDAPCSLSVELVGQAGFEAALSFRTTCEAETGDYACLDTATQGTLLERHASAGEYYVVVDGAHNTSGAFTLQVKCMAPVCGDGIVNPGELCDGGPGIHPLDGCGDPGTASECKLEAGPVANTCAEISGSRVIGTGQTLFLPDQLPLYDTTRATNEYESPTCSYVGVSGRDQVMSVQPSADGVLSLTIGQDYDGVDYCAPPFDQPTCWNHVMWVRESNCEGGQELACAWVDPVFDNGVSTLSFPVVAGRQYYVFVEGDLDDPSPGHNGPYLVRAHLD
ncbi:MAG: hypothetical protein U0414_03495 [Polyangiaceae bacterium]